MCNAQSSVTLLSKSHLKVRLKLGHKTPSKLISAVKVTHFLELVTVTVTVTFPKKELVTGKSYT